MFHSHCEAALPPFFWRSLCFHVSIPFFVISIFYFRYDLSSLHPFEQKCPSTMHRAGCKFSKLI